MLQQIVILLEDASEEQLRRLYWFIRAFLKKG